jgi:2-polyprenyl-6-methoxyphenol hydroxylase-like FAD-dependent oxidoreductase
MVLGLLLARAGVKVTVLEKHGDFLRDFRGDTIHPSTLEVLDDLGLADRFLELPHSQVAGFAAQSDGRTVFEGSFSGLRTRFPFIAFVPQWDFLRFVAAEARRYPSFRLVMNAPAESLLRAGDLVRGVRYRTPEGTRELYALLTVGADGRDSQTRAELRLPVRASAPPIDVLWFRLPRRPDDPDDLALRLGRGHFIVLINRDQYWQAAFVIPKGGEARVRAAGLPALRATVAELAPELADRTHTLADWDAIKLLTVRADRLRRWYAPGYLAIGDAAHAMSPVAGVGINVAIQDAVVAANQLWRPLRQGHVALGDLRRVQWRRVLPVMVVQAWQALLQRRILRPALTRGDRPSPGPRAFRLLALLRPLLIRAIAFGVSRTRVRTPSAAEPAATAATEPVRA